MLHSPGRRTYCLEHQRDEDQPSPRGLVCPLCHARLTQSPPRGICRSNWESQPAAYTVHGEPCWVYTLTWADFRIRSLHWNGDQGTSEHPSESNGVNADVGRATYGQRREMREDNRQTLKTPPAPPS